MARRGAARLADWRRTLVFVFLAGLLSLRSLTAPTPRAPSRSPAADSGAAASPAGKLLDPTPVALSGPRRPHASNSYGNLPLSFEANFAQDSPEVEFVARGAEHRIVLTWYGVSLPRIFAVCYKPFFVMAA
ncbi:MAG TPA: hypothetical protein VJH03_22535 [Blastocatellia bacterium]|nr:hypothetical protein [Blastocatellia bacterium]